ncbi:MAG TPA: GNAT family N-acetyltransferase [Candidatus Enterenecus faecium]|uniref:GNAT family N-acetyltransferase n=1 Tax=Candidatus Enterenecus faecium TaxID=2840780 RepID=A0A9D1CIQ1_9FIRM|nr:GNAT family N-acetyltransferase [Candidatus Enterenecus faecium]
MNLMVQKSEDTPGGFPGFRIESGKRGKIQYELGWFFNRRFWRQGYAFEACHAVIQYAFDALGAKKVFSETIDGVKSVALMEKLGMEREEIQPDPEHGWQWYVYAIHRE